MSIIELIKNDLAKSGLVPSDMNVRPATAAEFATCNIQNSAQLAYVIPYYSVTGAPFAFYRLRLLGGSAAFLKNKYRQAPNSQNVLYFPQMFLQVLEEHIISRSKEKRPAYVIITEGEKKATSACKSGFPTVGLSGVDSWRNRTITLPEEAEAFRAEGRTNDDGDRIKIRLPQGGLEDILEGSSAALGFNQLVELVINNNLTVFICYDSDPIASLSILDSVHEREAMQSLSEDGSPLELDNDEPSTSELEEAEMNPSILRTTHLKFEVQRAAAALGYELRSRGIPTHRIRQLILPLDEPTDLTTEPEKVGVDDFLQSQGADELRILIEENFVQRSAFPRHPAPKAYVLQQLGKKLSRKHFLALAMAIITELDARGRRLMDVNSRAPYYFDDEDHKLYPVKLSHRDPIHESAFGQLLYRMFGISGADNRLIEWIASLFTGEQPIDSVEPKRVYSFVVRPNDNPNFPCIALQISDSEYVIVSGDRGRPVEVAFNGAYGVLFETGHVIPIDRKELLTAFNNQSRLATFRPVEHWWRSTLMTLSVRDPAGTGADGKSETVSSVDLFTLLMYVSPFLLRWRDMQLPIEFYVGEAGSGKSSLAQLRLTVLTGRPTLRNMPNDRRDFYAGIVSCGGSYVVDNAKFTDRSIQQALSDDMCRITTEPDPHVELRKLYTTSDLFKAPVRTTFCWTAIEMPFRTVDLIQRSAILHLNAIAGQKDGDWVRKQLNYRGGRPAWLAHHMLFLHRFLMLAKTKWNPEYPAQHRLAHYEQALLLAGEVLGMDTAFLKPTLQASMERGIEDADWAMEGLREYAIQNGPTLNGHHFTVSDVVMWVQGVEEYANNDILKNPRMLGRYMQAHKQSIEAVAGIKESGSYGNRRVYRVRQASHDKQH